MTDQVNTFCATSLTLRGIPLWINDALDPLECRWHIYLPICAAKQWFLGALRSVACCGSYILHSYGKPKTLIATTNPPLVDTKGQNNYRANIGELCVVRQGFPNPDTIIALVSALWDRMKIHPTNKVGKLKNLSRRTMESPSSIYIKQVANSKKFLFRNRSYPIYPKACSEHKPTIPMSCASLTAKIELEHEWFHVKSHRNAKFTNHFEIDI